MNKFISLIIIVVFVACSKPQQKPLIEDVKSKFKEIQENTITNLYDAFGEDKPEMQKDFGFSCILKFYANQ